jgi:plastocyanin
MKHFSTFLIWGCCAFLGFSAADTPQEKNRISGKISMPSQEAVLQRGANNGKYCEQDPPSSRKKELDRQNHPNLHVVVSFHPQSFQAELPPSSNSTLNQIEQTFVPKVLPVVKGSTVDIHNNDSEVHKVFSMTPRAVFNIGRRQPGKSVPQVIDKVGVVEIRCDIHCGMNASILGLDTPYFTKADAQGNYSIDGLPDGTYRMQVFHHVMGFFNQTVEVKGGGVAYKNFDLTKP